MGVQPRVDGLLNEVAAEGSQFRDVLRKLLEKAYERGASDMRDSIMQAAYSSLPSPETAAASSKEQVGTEAAKDEVESGEPTSVSEKAPRGAVEQALKAVMTEKPGLIIVEYERMVTDLDPRISPKSVGNTLRRLEGEKHVRVQDKWYLKGTEPKALTIAFGWRGRDDSQSEAD